MGFATAGKLSGVVEPKADAVGAALVADVAAEETAGRDAGIGAAFVGAAIVGAAGEGKESGREVGGAGGIGAISSGMELGSAGCCAVSARNSGKAKARNADEKSTHNRAERQDFIGLLANRVKIRLIEKKAAGTAEPTTRVSTSQPNEPVHH